MLCVTQVGHSLWLSAVFLSLSCAIQKPPVPIQVPLADRNSTVIGELLTAATGKPVIQFLGIPFAEPPVNDLRFQKPVKKGKLNPNPYFANKMPNSCIQTPDLAFDDFLGATMWNANTETSEDCLYLNIWVPGGSIPTKTDKRLPVMIWVYGGGYWSGSITLDVYDGRIFSTEENVIVVSMNYRVTIFGFLYGGKDSNAPGNMGLLDQQLAMRWVTENIAEFGGDTSAITLFGESAGAASISFHILAPSSWPYFHRAIMQSGSATAPWALETRETLLERMINVAKACGCKNINRAKPNYTEALQCLRKVDADKVREAEWITNEFCDFPWTPVVDGDFLKDYPLQLLKRGRFHRGNILLGSNADESMYFIVYHLANVFRKEIFFEESDYLTTDESYVDAAVGLLPRKFVINRIAFDSIIHEYRDYSSPTTAIGRQRAIDRMLGDYHFTCNVNEIADFAAKEGLGVYMYLFDHLASQQPWPDWMGVLHGYEIMFVFGEPLNKSKNYRPQEVVLSRTMMRYWANFARTGDPNNGSVSVHNTPVWPRYTVNEKAYLVLADRLNIKNGLRRRYCAFWKSYLPRLESATSDIGEQEMRWKIAFDKWEQEYMRDWKHQLERYSRLQDLRSQDQSCDT